MKGRMVVGLVSMLMLMTVAITLHKATSPVLELVRKRSGGQGIEVLDLMQRTLAETSPNPASPRAGAGELERLASAFQALPFGNVGEASAGPLGGRGGSPAPASGSGAPPVASLELKTTLSTGDRRAALIEGPDGTIAVQVGTRIDGATVVLIESNRIVLRGPRGERVLRLDGDAEP